MSTIAVAALLAAAVAAAPPQAAAPSARVPGEILVKFGADAAPGRRAGAVSARAHAAVAHLNDDWTRVRVRSGESVEEAIAAYAAEPAVEHAQPNFVYRIAAAPDDPGYGQLWAFKNTGQTVTTAVQPGSGALYGHGSNPGTYGADIHIEPAWNVTTDCSGAVVAVLDTGVNYQHQDLAANMWDGGPSHPNHGRDYADGDDDPMDLHGHGTHIAGTIGASGHDGAGVAGVCWSARIMAVRVLDAMGDGTTASVIQGIDFAASNGARVINMSFGGGGGPDEAFKEAIGRAQSAGVVVIAAAGNANNDNDAIPQYPCSFPQPNIVCVAALDQKYQRAVFSNWGATSVDVWAPGTNILSAWPGTHSVFSEQYGSAASWSTTTTTTGGWSISGSTLADPVGYPFAQYNAGTDDRAWKAFDLSGTVVTVAFQAAIDLAANDWFRLACRAQGNDPFADSTLLGAVQGYRSARASESLWLDISACASAGATVGFQLESALGSRHDGVKISPLAFKKLYRNGASYNTLAGTSMATPLVAGLAALLRSYNPSFTYSDVVNAIVRPGRAVATGFPTTSGKAIDVAASLAYIQPPTGLSYVVH